MAEVGKLYTIVMKNNNIVFLCNLPLIIWNETMKLMAGLVGAEIVVGLLLTPSLSLSPHLSFLQSSAVSSCSSYLSIVLFFNHHFFCNILFAVCLAHQSFFETFGVPAMFVAPQAILSLYVFHYICYLCNREDICHHNSIISSLSIWPTLPFPPLNTTDLNVLDMCTKFANTTEYYVTLH